MAQFTILPEKTSYSIENGEDCISVKHNGGKSLISKYILNSIKQVSVQWHFNKNEYTYFRQFYRSIINQGCDCFTMNLLTESVNALTLHTVRFVPGTLTISLNTGQNFIVTAKLEVIPTSVI